MGDESWFYMAGNTREGPVPISDLRERFRRGELSRDTLVWCPGQPEWAAASSIAALQDAVELAPPTPPISKAAEVSQVRPWVRFGARFVDVSVFSTIGGLFLGITFPELFEDSTGQQIDNLLGMGFLFAWVFVEAGLLSSWGTTPGKWLLNTKLRGADGQRPTFSSALERSFMVWWRGLGIGFPIVTVITQIVAYRSLTSNGVTTWDRDGGFHVHHERVGPLRVLAMLGWFVVFFWLLLIGQMAQRGW